MMFMLYYVNNSNIFYLEDDPGMLSVYYQNIVELIKQTLMNNPWLNINIVVWDVNMEKDYYNFNNNNKTILVNINYEHTLVKKGGRGTSTNTPIGDVDDDNNDKYLVSINNYNILNISDIIIDYSNPNIHNIKTCPKYDKSFSDKYIYISASFYEPYFIKENRNITTLTTFINTDEPRRRELLNKISNEKLEHININNCFEKNKLQNILKNTKILINIHQTPHHHTFEELRVLPALECGVIVISEKSPLNELIPYNDLIIWANYEDIVEKTKEVINNYELYHSRIYSSKNIEMFRNLPRINYDVLENAILRNSN